jgi:hypothetical protein
MGDRPHRGVLLLSDHFPDGRRLRNTQFLRIFVSPRVQYTVFEHLPSKLVHMARYGYCYDIHGWLTPPVPRPVPQNHPWMMTTIAAFLFLWDF